MDRKNNFVVGFGIALVIVGLMLYIMRLEFKIIDLQDQIDVNRNASIQNRSYIYDITDELMGYPLYSHSLDENTGESITLYAYGYDDYPEGSRIDQLYEEMWGNVYWGLGYSENGIYEECGYNDLKPACPDSRLDMVFDELYVNPLGEDEPGDLSWSTIDSLYENNILYLFYRTDQLNMAICEIHPETYPLCAQ